MRRSRLIAVVVCLVLVLAGCGGGAEEQDPTPTPDGSATAAAMATSAAPEVTSTPAPDPTYGEVVWTTAVDEQSKEPTAPVDAFTTGTQTIYAAIQIRNVPPNTVLTADWTYNATSLDSLSTSTEVVEDVAETWVEFHLTRSDELWPDGTYAISIRAGSDVVASAEVTVDEPD